MHPLAVRARAEELRAPRRELPREPAEARDLPLVQMVANGLGVMLLPESAVAVEVRGRRELTVLPFQPPAPRRRIGLVWRRASARGDDYRSLGELLRPPRGSAPAPATTG
jgi:LysR family hydrogen peroxide-inducible transcriptional activator